MKALIPIFCFCLAGAPASSTGLLLAKEYQNQDITGWVMSEKLDGVRAYWDGKKLVSRQGYAFTPPAGIHRPLPALSARRRTFFRKGKF